MNEPLKQGVIILGNYITAGLGLTRNLGRKKIPVIWLDSGKNQIGFHSKYCKGLYCPQPKYNQIEYIDFLIKIGKTLNTNYILMPIGDNEVSIILKNKTRLEQYYTIPIAENNTVEKFLNKSKFYKTLDKNNISYPLTFFPKDISDVEKISSKITYPCIVKPEYSADFVLDFKTKLYTANSKKQLIDLYKKIESKNHKIMIQEIIDGNARYMYGLNAYYDKYSNPKGIFMYRRIREWPHKYGNGCIIENIVEPKLEKIINPLIKKIKYHGIIDAEFKKDQRDNTFKLIEINPRIWMQNSLPVRCGINIPYISYLDAYDKEFDISQLKKDKIKWLFFSEDFSSAFKDIINGKLTFKEWIRSYYGKKEYAIWARDDPLPFVIFYTKTLFETFISLFKKRIKTE